MSITEKINNIRKAVLGRDVRENIASAIEECYTDASTKDNANMEVKQARGNFSVLNDRLNNSDNVKAYKKDLDETNKNVAVNSARIDTFTKLSDGSTTGDAELQDIRVMADGTTANTAGGAVREQANNLNYKIDNFTNQFSIETEIIGTTEENKFINKYNKDVEDYANYNYCEVDVSNYIGKELNIYFTYRNSTSVYGVQFLDSNRKGQTEYIYFKEEADNADHTTEPFKVVVPSFAKTVYVNSYLSIPTVKFPEVDTNFVEKYNINMDITLNSAIRQNIGNFEGGACIFTCDDGLATDKDYIFPLIDTYNIPFVFGMWSESAILSTNLDDIKTYISNGCEVAQHHYVDLTNYSLEDNYNRFIAQKNKFKNLGIEVSNLIYPNNSTNIEVQKMASAFFDYACGGGYKLNKSHTKIYNLNRIWINGTGDFHSYIDNAIKNNILIIFGVHSSELATTTKLAQLKDTIEYAKKSGINITTLKGLNDF